MIRPVVVDDALVVVVPTSDAAEVAALVQRAHDQHVHRGGVPIDVATDLVDACRVVAGSAGGTFARVPGGGPAMVTANQAAARLGVSPRAVRKAAEAGRWPGALKFNRAWLIPAIDII